MIVLWAITILSSVAALVISVEQQGDAFSELGWWLRRLGGHAVAGLDGLSGVLSHLLLPYTTMLARFRLLSVELLMVAWHPLLDSPMFRFLPWPFGTGSSWPARGIGDRGAPSVEGIQFIKAQIDDAVAEASVPACTGQCNAPRPRLSIAETGDPVHAPINQRSRPMPPYLEAGVHLFGRLSPLSASQSRSTTPSPNGGTLVYDSCSLCALFPWCARLAMISRT